MMKIFETLWLFNINLLS